MQFVLPPADVTRLLVGHLQPCLPAPTGGAEMLSPRGAAYVSDCRCYYEALAREALVERALVLAPMLSREKDLELARRHQTPGYDVRSSARDEIPKLRARVIDPETGEVTREYVWNTRPADPLRWDMRIRGPRKQGAARAARRTEMLNTEVLDELRSKLMEDKRPHQVDDLHPVKAFQGARTTNFKTGEKYTGPTPGKKRRSKARTSSSRVSEASPLDAETEKKLEASLKKLFGLE